MAGAAQRAKRRRPEANRFVFRGCIYIYIYTDIDIGVHLNMYIHACSLGLKVWRLCNDGLWDPFFAASRQSFLWSSQTDRIKCFGAEHDPSPP